MDVMPGKKRAARPLPCLGYALSQRRESLALFYEYGSLLKEIQNSRNPVAQTYGLKSIFTTGSALAS
jgi:hypothetical protein